MKAVRFVQPGRPLELHDLPQPHPGGDDVLVRVTAAGICRSNLSARSPGKVTPRWPVSRTSFRRFALSRTH